MSKMASDWVDWKPASVSLRTIMRLMSDGDEVYFSFETQTWRRRNTKENSQ